MCYSEKSSIHNFFIFIISSLCLLYFGNEKYKKENIIVGFFFIFVSFMQLFDYMFWIDLDNKKGLNHIATLIAPFYLIIYNQQYYFY